MFTNRMYPYVELFGTKLYMTGIGIVMACIVFLITGRILSKKYHQEFMRLFNWLPWLLIPTYIIGLYTSFVLDYGLFIPTSLHFLSPYGYNFSFVGILIACFFSVLLFMTQFRRSETKKIWLDILFFSFINAVIVLGIFLVLWDDFIGKPYGGALGVKALMGESALVKYESVFPIGIFLSLGALLINVIITLWKLSLKKAGLGLWGFIFLFLFFMILLPFWNYPAHGVISVFGKLSLDLNYYVLFILILYCLLWQKKLKKPY